MLARNEVKKSEVGKEAASERLGIESNGVLFVLASCCSEYHITCVEAC